MRNEDTYLDDAYDMGIGNANAGEIVQYYAKRPVTVSTGTATGSIVGAFALGALSVVGIVALARLFERR